LKCETSELLATSGFFAREVKYALTPLTQRGIGSVEGAMVISLALDDLLLKGTI
jgi:hypothetical protein